MDRQHQKAMSNKWKKDHSSRHAELARAYRRRNPEKIVAQNRLNYAIAKGLMSRQPCEACGTTSRVHAHHEDYTKPLDVHWLCYLCHKAAHPVSDEDKVVKFDGAKPAAPRGENQSQAKLSDFAVRVVRKLLASEISQTSIAETFGVWQSTISTIKLGKGWTHVPESAA